MNKNSTSRGAVAPLLGSQIELVIEKLAAGGNGVARKDNFVFFVPMTAPQERVLAEVTLVKKNYAEAKIVQILSPGPARRSPPCAYSTHCGGCNWQHFDEKEQQNQKEKIVRETLQKFNPEVDFEYLPIRPSPKKLRYRNRIQPKYSMNAFGFFARGSHEVIDIKDCLITEEAITEKFSEIRAWAKSQNQQGTLKMEAHLSEDGKVHFKKITDSDDGVGFAQVNRFQNEELIATVLSWAGDLKYETIFDLYAGAGNFTFPLAKQFQASKIIAIELNKKLVRRAQEKINDGRMQFHTADVEAFVRKAQITSTDLVVLDPPRAGASAEVMQNIGQSGPKKIIYISCHPVSLARDINTLLTSAVKVGKRLRVGRVQAFEMFPQTDHVETIAELHLDT